MLLRQVHLTSEESADIDVETTAKTISVTTTKKPTTSAANENLAAVESSKVLRTKQKLEASKKTFTISISKIQHRRLFADEDEKSSASDGKSNETTSAKPALEVEMKEDVAEKVAIGGSSVDGNVEEEETTNFVVLPTAPETSSAISRRTSRVRGGVRRRSQ